MKRLLVLLYGMVVYVMFLGVVLYAIGFVGNLMVPKGIDSGAAGPIATALLINALLLAVFAIQHTIMARPAFKEKISKIIPAAIERSTFVLVTNLIFILIFWQWRPVQDIVWQVDNGGGRMALNVLFWLGWGLMIISTFFIDHFELFGLKQVISYFRKKQFNPPKFMEIGSYKYIRHPLMTGFIIAFWATPTMTVGHLFFAIMTTGYILVGIAFEERDLIKHHGQLYVDYARRVPMLIPFVKFGQSGGKPTPEPQEEKISG